MTVTASAISGILKKAGFKRASARGISWSSGFVVKDFGGHVRVEYTAVNTDQALQTLKQMADRINSREGKKYFAQVRPLAENSSTTVLKVTAYDETDPEQNRIRNAEAQEKLAVEHPGAPEIADIRKALRRYSKYDADLYGFGYQVERLEEDRRLVRVSYVETTHTTYETDRDDQIAKTLANYARVVHEAGFEFQVRDDEMSIIVAQRGEWSNTLADETVSTVLHSAHTPWSADGGGFAVRVYGKDKGAVRVQHYPFRLDDEKTAYATVKRYRSTLEKAGYEAVEDPSDDWALLVTVAAPPQPQEAPKAEETAEEVRIALLTLRELVEADESRYSTRRAGDHSIFVMAVNLRVEVFYSNGEYKIKIGKGNWQRFAGANSELLDLIRDELDVRTI